MPKKTSWLHQELHIFCSGITAESDITFWPKFKGKHLLPPSGYLGLLKSRQAEEKKNTTTGRRCHAMPLFKLCTSAKQVIVNLWLKTQKKFKSLTFSPQNDLLISKCPCTFSWLVITNAAILILTLKEGTLNAGLYNSETVALGKPVFTSRSSKVSTYRAWTLYLFHNI